MGKVDLKGTNKVIIGYKNLGSYLEPIVYNLNDFGEVEIYASGKLVMKAVFIVNFFKKLGLNCDVRSETLDKAKAKVYTLRMPTEKDK